ncbi:MAG: GNAT family N-acetyltransferase [Caldilineaceae bacterium]|nr:GNAT family N-acetyltransferase [Caldilineaceae bacterium]
MIQLKQIAGAAELALAQQIRRTVFVDEQGIPAELEYDAEDERAVHVLAYKAERPIATGRLLVETPEVGTLGRIAVLPSERGQGIGAQIVRALESHARAAGLHRLVLHPHAYLEKFYTDLGYQTIPGAESTVGRHRLILMEKQL